MNLYVHTLFLFQWKKTLDCGCGLWTPTFEGFESPSLKLNQKWLICVKRSSQLTQSAKIHHIGSRAWLYCDPGQGFITLNQCWTMTWEAILGLESKTMHIVHLSVTIRAAIMSKTMKGMHCNEKQTDRLITRLWFLNISLDCVIPKWMLSLLLHLIQFINHSSGYIWPQFKPYVANQYIWKCEWVHTLQMISLIISGS